MSFLRDTGVVYSRKGELGGTGIEDKGCRGMGRGRELSRDIENTHAHLTRYMDLFCYLGLETCF